MSNAVAGSYAATMSARGGGITKTLVLTAVSISSAVFHAVAAVSVNIAAGSTAKVTFSIIVSGAFNSSLGLSVSGMPAAVAANFSNTSIAPPGARSSTLTLARGSSTSAGTSSIVVTASGGGLKKTATITLIATK